MNIFAGVIDVQATVLCQLMEHLRDDLSIVWRGTVDIQGHVYCWIYLCMAFAQ